MSFDYAVPPFKFSDETFLAQDMELFLDYVGYRVQGMFSSDAFRRVYGEENAKGTQAHERVINLEHTWLFRNTFKAALDGSKVSDLWNAKVSIHELLSLVRNPYTKDNTRLAAQKELNILIGITVVDENGKTKAGASLNDFYAKEGIPTETPAETGEKKTAPAPWEDAKD